MRLKIHFILIQRPCAFCARTFLFKGSLGFNSSSSALFMFGVFFVATTSVSINYIWDHGFQNIMYKYPLLVILASLFGWIISFFRCAFENHTLRFSDNSLTIKNYFIGIEEVFKYENINEIKISGALIPIGQKYFGIRMNIETKEGKKRSFELKNFDRDEIEKIFKKLNKVGISYSHIY